MDVITNRDMTDRTGPSGKQAALADDGASRNCRLSRHCSVRADLHVMTYHALIIDTHPVFHNCVVERAAINRRIRTNLDVATNTHAA